MATKVTTRYYIDYITEMVNGVLNTYYQIVRTKDDAILYANPDWHNIVDYMWHANIRPEEIIVL